MIISEKKHNIIVDQLYTVINGLESKLAILEKLVVSKDAEISSILIEKNNLDAHCKSELSALNKFIDKKNHEYLKSVNYLRSQLSYVEKKYNNLKLLIDDKSSSDLIEGSLDKIECLLSDLNLKDEIISELKTQSKIELLKVVSDLSSEMNSQVLSLRKEVDHSKKLLEKNTTKLSIAYAEIDDLQLRSNYKINMLKEEMNRMSRNHSSYINSIKINNEDLTKYKNEINQLKNRNIELEDITSSIKSHHQTNDEKLLIKSIEQLRLIRSNLKSEIQELELKFQSLVDLADGYIKRDKSLEILSFESEWGISRKQAQQIVDNRSYFSFTDDEMQVFFKYLELNSSDDF